MAVADAPASEVSEEASATGGEAQASDLVSDSDFAASLALGSEEEQPEDSEEMELSAEDIVEDEKPSDTPAPEEKAAADKVLEDAR